MTTRDNNPDRLDDGARAEAEMKEREALGRFGHHPDPAIDFEIEVQCLEARLFDAKGKISKPGTPPETVEAVKRDIERAMDFRVGGDVGAVNAKQFLRKLEAEANAALPAPQGDGGLVWRFEEPVAYRYRHSDQENWYFGPDSKGWWECQPLYSEATFKAQAAEIAGLKVSHAAARENFHTMQNAANKLRIAKEAAESLLAEAREALERAVTEGCTVEWHVHIRELLARLTAQGDTR